VSRAVPSLHARALRRSLLVLVLVLVAPFAPTAVAPAAAAPLFASATTGYTTNPDPVVGERFQIVGQVFLLMGDTPAPLPNQTVTLQRRANATDPWVSVATATTSETTLPNGEKHIMFTFNRVADRTASFRVTYAGNADSIGASASDDEELVPALVRVHRKMPIRLLQPSPSRIDMAGSVTPLYARQRVAVLRKTCRECAWAPFAKPLTDSQGRYRVRLSSPRSGSHYFVARARASRGFALSSSQQARIQAG
jgi:hypothetical protein